MENVLEVAQRVLTTTPEYWTHLTAAAPAELLGRVPAAGEWSAVECLLHIVDFESQGVPGRIQSFLDGSDFPPYLAGSLGSGLGAQTPVKMAAEFARLRRANLERVAGLSPADMHRKARHPKLGEVTFEEMMHQWVAHDLNHTIQAQRAIMQPFIEGCGPWQFYFADHVVKAK